MLYRAIYNVYIYIAYIYYVYDCCIVVEFNGFVKVVKLEIETCARTI